MHFHFTFFNEYKDIKTIALKCFCYFQNVEFKSLTRNSYIFQFAVKKLYTGMVVIEVRYADVITIVATTYATALSRIHGLLHITKFQFLLHRIEQSVP